MAAPVWKTASGTLGTIQEELFFELEIEAQIPNDLDGKIVYQIIAGALPAGLVMTENGSIRGQPKERYFIGGVPNEVKQDVTSVFCCRATNAATKQITDRTFSITVTGEDPPVLITRSGELGKFLDSKKISIQLEAVDLDGEPISWSIVDGSLPPGLTLDNSTGVISGYPAPPQLNTLDNNVGWSADSPWDKDPWDFGSKTNSVSYQFVVQVTDGKTYDNAQYSIFIYSQNALTADNDYIYSDLIDVISADMDIKRNPVLLTEATDLGVYVHDNYFAYRFIGKDFDGDKISYSLLIADNVGFDNEENGYDSGFFDAGDLTLPPGLVLNSDTGWMYGQIPRQVTSQTDYRFAIRTYKTDYPEYQSKVTYFTLTIINDLRFLVTWQTNSDLGTLNTGEISEKSIVAVNPLNRALTYSLDSGKLPQGLRLLSDGLIVGRASFELTTFDNSTTTLDKNVSRLDSVTETTIDHEYTFTVKANDANQELVSYKRFNIRMLPSSFAPYESLYLKASPSTSDRALLQSIIKNSDVLPNESLYRNSDPNFGLAKDLRMLLLAGINAANPEDYIMAMATNHYRKTLRLGNYKWANALDKDGNAIYDVVYIDVVDDLSISNTLTAPASIDLSGKIQKETLIDNSFLNVDNVLSTIDGAGGLTVYPNSILNMRSVIRNKIGLATKEPLPKWMTSKQADGRILGWTPAVVIAYVKVGEGEKVVFNLNRLGIDIKEINFETDRYIWDTNLSKNWNVNSNSYDESKLTTFDITQNQTTIVATADFAVSIPFNEIDGSTIDYLDQIGGLDGIIDSYVGKRIVFAQQENFQGYEGELDGWIRYNSLWDDDSGWSNSDWDDYEIIPGYFDDVNQRAAVWIITTDSNGVIRLEVDQIIEPNESVEIKNGVTYGGYILKFGPNIMFSENETVPRYSIYNSVEKAVETTFDNEDTKFVDSISIYEEPDEGDKYLAYPRRNIWA